jgi:uncharacterized protein (DUF111 family)
MAREFETVETPYGPVRMKKVAGYDTERAKFEFDDLSRIARQQGWNLSKVRRIAEESLKVKEEK